MPTPEVKKLPGEFADLEKFSGWILESEPERYRKRLASTMPEMQAVYDALFPRLEEALDYLDQFPLDEMPDDARYLTHLMQSLIMVSFPVEVWKQPRVPDSGAAYLDLVRETVV
ncbi:hypothetical protein AB0L57_03095 [Nocardia sp. NPDC052254]|uniref:hypothetical protein n=1 Tax=Nocardia sp. NPDC052254 TaxID=3155681 RepID=UPI0034378122